MNDEARNRATADRNIARQEQPQREPKRDEPGHVYNEDGAKIQNPGPVDGPYAPGPGQVVGERQLGTRVTQADPADIKGIETPSPNPGDKMGGEALTPSEPGSAGVQRTAPAKSDAKPKARK